jgi:hypothetical protein
LRRRRAVARTRCGDSLMDSSGKSAKYILF